MRTVTGEFGPTVGWLKLLQSPWGLWDYMVSWSWGSVLSLGTTRMKTSMRFWIIHIPMASHEHIFQICCLHFVMMQVEVAGFSCHVPAMREGTQSQESALAKEDEDIRQKKQADYSYMKQSRLCGLYGYGGGKQQGRFIRPQYPQDPIRTAQLLLSVQCTPVSVSYSFFMTQPGY